MREQRRSHDLDTTTAREEVLAELRSGESSS